MTIEELDRLQRGVEELARQRAAVGPAEPAAFAETVAAFRRLASLARRALATGGAVEPRLSSGLRSLAAMLGPPDWPAGLRPE